jgi:hypothetical protein
MKVLISEKCAQAIADTNDRFSAKILARQVATESIDLGSSAVFRIPLRGNTNKYLYIDSLEWNSAVSQSMEGWVDDSWNDPAEDFAIPEQF